MFKIKYRFTKIYLFSIALGLFISFPVFAQVNINSRQGDDSTYYELTDTIILIEESADLGDTGQIKDNDFLGIFTRETTDENGNTQVSTIFDGLQDAIENSPFIPDAVKRFVLNNSVPTSVSFGLFLVLLPLFLSFLPLLLAPQLLFVLLGSLFGERKHVLGIVFDSRTRKPIPFVVVRLYKSGSTQLVTQKISDLQGRYGFILSEGNYRLTVNQSGYQQFQKEIIIGKEVELFTEDIPLSKELRSSFIQSIKNFYERIRRFIFKYSIVLSVIGFLFALIGFYLKREIFDFILLMIYTFVLGLYVLLKIKNRRQHWGVVKDSKSGLLISGAFVRIFDNKNNLSDTQITDENGRYSFFVDPGEYTLFTQAYGYKFPSTLQESEVKTANASSLLGFTATKSQWVDKTIYVDPDSSNSQKQNFNVTDTKVLPYKSENLNSPFN